MMTLTKFVAFGILALMSCTSYAQGVPSMNKHGDRGVTCQMCHEQEAYKPVPAEKCRSCHNGEDLAKRTERLNFTSKMKDAKTGKIKQHLALVNPHDSYHFGKTEDCNDCHRNHKTSVNDCAICHDVKAWGMKDPK